MTQLTAVLAAFLLAMVTANLSVSLMTKYGLSVPIPSARQQTKQVSLHALGLAPICFFAWMLYGASTKSVLLIIVAATLLILASMDAHHRKVPESLIFFFAIICAASTVLGQSGISQEVAFTGMLCVASALGVVIQVTYLKRKLSQLSHTAPRYEFSPLVLGSGDTLVLIAMAGFIGVNVLYVIFIAAICSVVQRVVTRLVLAPLEAQTNSRKEFAFIPSIYVGFVITVIIDPLLRANHIDTLNSTTRQILRHF